MKKKNQHYVLTQREFMLISNLIEQYSLVCDYVKQHLMSRQLLSTEEVSSRYSVSRHTIYRLQRAKRLVPIARHRCYYFDATETEAFFQKYWQRLFSLITLISVS